MGGILAMLHAGRGSQRLPASDPLALISEGNATVAADANGRIAAGHPADAACRRALARVSDDGFALFIACPA